MARPSRYDSAYCAQLEAHMGAGLSFSSFGGKAKVTKETLYQWVSRYPAFADSKRRGELASLYWWESIGQMAMLGGEIKIGGKAYDGRKVNAAMWIFTMKCRFRDEGWRDDKVIEAAPMEPFIVQQQFTGTGTLTMGAMPVGATPVAAKGKKR
ncbi:MAG: hypothetical protein V4750_02645 [Pseudomonadota bacterium]